MFLILGEIWSKRGKFTSLLLVKVFAKVADVNTQALVKEKSRQNLFSYSCLCILFAAAKNAEICRLQYYR